MSEPSKMQGRNAARRSFRPTPSTWIVGAVAVIVLIIGATSGGIAGLVVFAALFALCTAIYSLLTGRRSWALIASRKVAALILAGSLVLTIIGGSLVPRSQHHNDAHNTSSSNVTAAVVPSKVTPKPSPAAASFTSEEPDAPATITADPDPATVSVASTTSTSQTANVLLAQIPTKGRAPKTNYARVADFGTAWLDVDHNGCDTRDDILGRDLTDLTRSGSCRILSGTLISPYTNGLIHFVRGEATSALVQIDHMVSLGDAWQTGAQQLTQAQRVSLANDPLNLVAVDGRSNDQKGDGDAATWLPANKAYRCTYVEHQVAVKATYGLWMTQAEHDAIARVLTSCADQPILNSKFTPLPVKVAPKPAAKPAPVKHAAPPKVAPAKPAPAHPATVVHPGAFCSTNGARGVTNKGTAMVCSYKAGDPRLRWRAA